MIFRKKSQPEPTPAVVTILSDDSPLVPPGVVVRAGDDLWLIKSNKTRLRIPDGEVAKSWNFPYVLPCTEGYLSKYVNVGTTGFRDGSIIRDWSTGKIYIISERRKCLVKSRDDLTKVFPEFEKFVLAADEKTAGLHRDGEPCWA